MKRVLCFSMLIVFSLCSTVYAEEKVHTTIFLRSNIALKSGGKHAGEFYAHWAYRLVGVELDVQTVPTTDYLSAKSSVTLQKGPLYAVSGVSTDSDGAQYLNAGVWYADTLGAFSVFFDGRTYLTLNSAGASYLDTFVTVKRGLWARSFAGLDLVFDHWWGANHNLYLAGPYIGRRISDSASLLVRVSRTWDMAENASTTDDRVRVELSFHF